MNVTVTTDLGVLQIEDAQPAQVDRLLNYVSLHLASQEDTVEVELDEFVDKGRVDGFCWPECWLGTIKAIARDENGLWYAYRDEVPEPSVGKWFTRNGTHFELTKNTYKLPVSDKPWTESLILNPYIDHEEQQDAS